VYGEELSYTLDGQLRTASFLDYGMPSIDQAPNIQTELVEVPSPHHPLGAKGVGEPPAIPPPAAVTNAIRAAGGPRLTRLPVSPEAIVAGLGGLAPSSSDFDQIKELDTDLEPLPAPTPLIA
jgi:CO/xanthine dehydrogenase Mo-binding subunit